MENDQQIKKSSKLPVIITAVIGIVLTVVVAIIVRTVDGNTLTTGETQLKSLRSELVEVSAELSSSQKKLDNINAQIEIQSKKIEPPKDIYNASLAAGTYTVGVDIEPGIYHFTYQLKNSKHAYTDYIYVLYANSEGADETYGGIKFDYCTQARTNGEQVMIKLDNGSKVTVESDFGLFTPGKDLSTVTEADS